MVQGSFWQKKGAFKEMCTKKKGKRVGKLKNSKKKHEKWLSPSWKKWKGLHWWYSSAIEGKKVLPQ